MVLVDLDWNFQYHMSYDIKEMLFTTLEILLKCSRFSPRHILRDLCLLLSLEGGIIVIIKSGLLKKPSLNTYQTCVNVNTRSLRSSDTLLLVVNRVRTMKYKKEAFRVYGPHL